MAEITQVKPDERIRTFLGWFSDAFRWRQKWRVEALENYDFVEGGTGQWDAKDLKQLDDEGRPAFTFNKILPQILALSGLQRANRLDIRALPRGSSDAEAADLMSHLLKFVEDRSNGDYEQTTAFEDGMIAGLGALEIVRSFDDDFEGELLIRSLDPLQVFPDPESRRADWDDARFVFKAPFRDVEEIIFRFAAGDEDGPKRQRIRDMAARMQSDDWLTAYGVDRTLTGNLRAELGEAFFDRKTLKVRILECHYRTTRRIPVVVAGDGEVHSLETRNALLEDAERLARSVGGTAEMRPVKIVRISSLLGWEELQNVESPFPTRRFSIIPYMPLFFRRQPWGLVRHLKDPQREINKRRSQVLHHLNTTAHSGWLNHASEGADPKTLERFGSAPGVVVNYQSVEPKQIVPHPLAPGFVQLDALADRDMKEIGVQAELLGVGTQRFISGRAIQARQFGGQLQTVRYFDQLRLTRKLIGELLVSIIPRVLSERRIREIVDQEAARAPDGELAQLVAGVRGTSNAPLEGRDAVDDLIDRARKIRFDIVVEDNPSLPTARQAAFQQLVQIGAMFPGLIPPDVLLEHSDVANKDELIARLEEQVQGLGPAGLMQIAQQGRRTAGVSEQLDVGDAGQQAQLLAGGQLPNSLG